MLVLLLVGFFSFFRFFLQDFVSFSLKSLFSYEVKASSKEAAGKLSFLKASLKDSRLILRISKIAAYTSHMYAKEILDLKILIKGHMIAVA